MGVLIGKYLERYSLLDILRVVALPSKPPLPHVTLTGQRTKMMLMEQISRVRRLIYVSSSETAP